MKLSVIFKIMKISDNADVKLQKTFKYNYVRQANNIILIQVKSVAFTTIYEGKQQRKSYSLPFYWQYLQV